MNITFFIGNGFDINLGLHTKYKEFYPYFIEKADKNNMIKGWIEKEWDPENDKTWADLELELGNKTTLIPNDAGDDFIVDLLELDNLLLDYLEEQQKSLDIAGKEEDLSKEFVRSFNAITDGFSTVDRDIIKGLKKTYAHEHFYYSFITFNYTDALDRMFVAAKKKNSIVGTHTSNVGQKNETYGDICHIHGNLNSGMILGVNDPEQIKNETLRNNSEFLDAFIKMRMNAIAGQKKMERAEEIIKNSKIIFLFGMSIGDTDKLWWERIVQWLKETQHAKLIIFYRCDEKDKAMLKRQIPAAVNRTNERIKEDFLRKGGMNKEDSDYLDVSKKVFVSYDIYANMFDFKSFGILKTTEEVE